MYYDKKNLQIIDQQDYFDSKNFGLALNYASVSVSVKTEVRKSSYLKINTIMNMNNIAIRG